MIYILNLSSLNIRNWHLLQEIKECAILSTMNFALVEIISGLG